MIDSYHPTPFGLFPPRPHSVSPEVGRAPNVGEEKVGGANKVSQFPGFTTKGAVWRATAAAGSGTDREAAAAAAASLQQTQKPNGVFLSSVYCVLLIVYSRSSVHH